MRVDFYQLSHDPVERTAALLAGKVLAAGQRLLVVSEDAAQLRRISEALWSDPSGDFLAHGVAGDGHDDRQPILLGAACDAANGARMVMFADGQWRDGADQFDRTLLLFDDERIAGARQCWKMLGQKDGAERHFWRQEDGKWKQGP